MSALFLSELYSDCAAELRTDAPVACEESPAVTAAREAARARMAALGITPIAERRPTPVEPPMSDGPDLPALLRRQAE